MALVHHDLCFGCGQTNLFGLLSRQVCIGSSVNSGYNDLALCGAVLADRGGQIVDPDISCHGDARLAADPRPRIARVRGLPSALRRRRAHARARLRPLRGHGPGAPVGCQLAAHLQPQLPRPLAALPEDSVFLCSPAVAAVSLLSGEIEDPREYGGPAELLPMPELRPVRRRRPHLRAGRPERRRSAIEIPRGPNIKRPPEHTAARRLAGGQGRDRPARRHLHRRSGARRRRGDGLPLQRPRDRRVHLAPPRSGLPRAR